MTTWTVGTTPDDAYAVYRDGELYFIAASENGEAQPAKARAEWLAALLQAHEDVSADDAARIQAMTEEHRRTT